MKNGRKLLIAVFCTALIFSKNPVLFAQASTISTETTGETKIIGEIEATIINVSVPTVMAFNVDPNNKDESYVASVSTIKNLTNAPIEISISEGANNFKQDPNSSWKPADVLPTEKDWEDLGVKGSEENLALGLKVTTPSQWRKLSQTETLWVKTQNTSSSRIVIGEIKTLEEADITLEIYHGRAFKDDKNCSYNIIWTFALASD